MITFPRLSVVCVYESTGMYDESIWCIVIYHFSFYLVYIPVLNLIYISLCFLSSSDSLYLFIRYSPHFSLLSLSSFSSSFLCHHLHILALPHIFPTLPPLAFLLRLSTTMIFLLFLLCPSFLCYLHILASVILPTLPATPPPAYS